MKVILSEIKKNLQRVNSGVDEAENQSNDLEHEEAKKQSEQEERIQKTPRILLSTFWDNFKHSNIRITGVPEGEESKKLEIYLKK